MGLLDASQSSGGSVSNSVNSASGWSNTAGVQASQTAQQAAATANNSAMAAWQAAAHYNSKEAQKQREWQERMANTVYQRSVADMKAAGINPILAAGMGLGTASVGSGATASLSSPNSFMSNTFPEQNSASTASGESHGSSWNEATSGLTTALGQIIDGLTGALSGLSSGMKIDINLNDIAKKMEEATRDTPAKAKEKVKQTFTPDASKYQRSRILGRKGGQSYIGGNVR